MNNNLLVEKKFDEIADNMNSINTLSYLEQKKLKTF